MRNIFWYMQKRLFHEDNNEVENIMFEMHEDNVGMDSYS